MRLAECLTGFYAIPECDGQTDRHILTAYRAIKTDCYSCSNKTNKND